MYVEIKSSILNMKAFHNHNMICYSWFNLISYERHKNYGYMKLSSILTDIWYITLFDWTFPLSYHKLRTWFDDGYISNNEGTFKFIVAAILIDSNHWLYISITIFMIFSLVLLQTAFISWVDWHWFERIDFRLYKCFGMERS